MLVCICGGCSGVLAKNATAKIISATHITNRPGSMKDSIRNAPISSTNPEVANHLLSVFAETILSERLTKNAEAMAKAEKMTIKAKTTPKKFIKSALGRLVVFGVVPTIDEIEDQFWFHVGQRSKRKFFTILVSNTRKIAAIPVTASPTMPVTRL